MEQDKVRQAQRYLKEQKEECEKMMFEHQNHHKSCQDVVRQAVYEKMKLTKEAEDLEHKIATKETEVKRLDDELMSFKSHKRFLDILAIKAGRKQYAPKMNLTSMDGASTAHETGALVTQQKGGDGGTFMTTVGRATSKMADTKSSWGKAGKFGRQQPKTPAGLQANAQTSATFNRMTPGAPGMSAMDAEKDREAMLKQMQEEIDLEHSQYEDDVYKVYFANKRDLIQYSNEIEDDNLFKINLVQEAEVGLERIMQKSKQQQALV